MAPNSGIASNVGCVRLTDSVLNDIGSLFSNEAYSDITLLVDGQRFPAHKAILAARSEFFRALLYGQMLESNQSEITLKENDPAAFNTLLRFIYTGNIDLTTMLLPDLFQLLRLSEMYLFEEFHRSIFEYLKSTLSVQSFWEMYGIVHLWSMSKLADPCLEFADQNAEKILEDGGYLVLSAAAIEDIIRRDTFRPPELKIFRVVRHWIEMNGSDDALLSHVRLWLMSAEELDDEVRKSGLFMDTAISPALSFVRGDGEPDATCEIRHRCFTDYDVNVVSASHGAEVLKGTPSDDFSLNGDGQGFLSHRIDRNKEGIVFKLGAFSRINYIRFRILDKHYRPHSSYQALSYSYFVEISTDGQKWTRIVDYSAYFCCEMQNLYFAPEVVKYVRICASSGKRDGDAFSWQRDVTFRIDNVHACFRMEPRGMENGFLVLNDGGKNETVPWLIDRNRVRSIYGMVKLMVRMPCPFREGNTIVIRLPQPSVMDTFRMKFPDLYEPYKYSVETSTDEVNWKSVADKRNEWCRSDQSMNFDRHAASFIRITVTKIQSTPQERSPIYFMAASISASVLEVPQAPLI